MKKTSLLSIFSIFIILLMIINLMNKKEKYMGDLEKQGLCDCCKCGLINCEKCVKNSKKCCNGNLFNIDRMTF